MHGAGWVPWRLNPPGSTGTQMDLKCPKGSHPEANP
jgi:hypothetical protein